MKNTKKLAALFLSGLMLTNLAACGTENTTDAKKETDNTSVVAATTESAELKTPKYVFMFIGDGMSYPQIQSTADYLGALNDEDYFMAQPSLDDNEGAILDGPKYLNFMNFEAVGSAVTYDSNSFAPDSASTATSLSTDKKTYSGTINVDETGTKTYETITEKVHEHLADSDSMAYEIDRTEDMWSLADYVSKGIEVLDNEKGFFMMCEGGKIDWACHANDAASSINDTIALSNAVQVAVNFAKDHADETLIIVTGDHETGGLTIGFAGTDYDTYLTLLESQKISFAKYDSDYVATYKENKTPFEDVLKDVETLFGLKATGEEGDKCLIQKVSCMQDIRI